MIDLPEGNCCADLGSPRHELFHALQRDMWIVSNISSNDMELFSYEKRALFFDKYAGRMQVLAPKVSCQDPLMAVMPSGSSRVPKLLELCFDFILFDSSEALNLIRGLRRKPPKIVLEALSKISNTFYPLSLWALRAAGHDWQFCASWKTSQCAKMTNISTEKLCGA